jgi:tetratricopeptide (TPR) repeat protein
VNEHRASIHLIIASVLLVTSGAVKYLAAQHRPSAAIPPITIDYPVEGSIFPPEITPPTFLWRDAAPGAAVWRIKIAFDGAFAPMEVLSRGERLRIGEIDPRCVARTNELPRLRSEQMAAHTWTPPPETWDAIKKFSSERPATITIAGFRDENSAELISRGKVAMQTSKDPVGAPIFYRDVPLMPSELERGVIKPLATSALPLVAWRLRDVGEPRSKLLMEGLHTCANCHSFSLDGKTLAMDMDGPRSDKGMYAIVRLAPRTTIRSEDVVTWSSFRRKLGGLLRVGFMSQVSPDGRYVATTIDGSGADAPGGNPTRALKNQSNYYVANFKDYRFLQVFYPTRGMLAWYSRVTGRLQPLRGADDPAYVQASAVWSPDGKYLVFARASAKDPYPDGAKPAAFANDPNETQIQFDLYRIPFNEGQGGKAEPIAGASHNGMSNTFPKVSPDGRWIVFTQCRNGLLMRPDSQLYIVPAGGGEARRMRANTPLMNSWHSFSPNGRWLVFSSKSRSPYTQMFLTHIDENGNDSPAILIENSTAANRAVNIPEFVNITAGGLLSIDAPAAEFYRLFDRAWELAEKRRFAAAVGAWNEALKLNPADSRAHYNQGIALAMTGRFNEAIAQYQMALESNPDFAEVHNNLGVALARTGKVDDAIAHYRKAVDLNPEGAEFHTNLGVALVWKGNPDEAIAQFGQALKANPEFVEAHHSLGDAFYYLRGNAPAAMAQWREVLRLRPDYLAVLNQTAWLLATTPDANIRNGAEAVELAQRAARLSGGREPEVLGTLAAAYAEVGKFSEAIETSRRALVLAAQRKSEPLAEALKARMALYQKGVPFRESPPAASAQSR